MSDDLNQGGYIPRISGNKTRVNEVIDTPRGCQSALSNYHRITTRDVRNRVQLHSHVPGSRLVSQSLLNSDSEQVKYVTAYSKTSN